MTGVPLAALVAALALQQFEAPGLFKARAIVNGRDSTDECRLYAYAEGRPQELALDAPMVDGLRLAAGAYRVRIECRTEDGPLVTWLHRVAVASNRTTARSLQLRTGAIIVQTERDGGTVYAEVAVEGGRGAVVASGQSGNRLVVAAGSYQVRVKLSPEGTIPCQIERTIRVAAGRTARLNLDLSDGTVRFAITRNGKPASGLVVLHPANASERLIEFATGHEALVPPGRYDATVTLESSYDFEGKRVKGLEVRPGMLAKKTVAFVTGKLQAEARIQGQPVAAKVYLYLPGALDYFNFFTSGQSIDLSPGRYRLRAILDDSVPYTAARPVGLGVERSVAIRVGKSEVVGFDFTPGALIVHALKNRKPAQAALTIWTHKPRVRLTAGAANETLAIAAGVYDVDVLFPNGRGGDLVQIKGVALTAGSTVRRSVNIERGSITIDSYDRGSRIDAEIRFYKKSSKAPFAVVRGGDAAELPPGVYEIEMVYGDRSRWVSPMRVAAGSWEVRKVEF
ncbi:MAG: hypothetical protein JXR83_14370 [Deltaproteobacteria bacterium]|nr:hypothetical protein [Deltaproteobacteria bacterium]